MQDKQLIGGELVAGEGEALAVLDPAAAKDDDLGLWLTPDESVFATLQATRHLRDD